MSFNALNSAPKATPIPKEAVDAFADRPDIQKRIVGALAQYPIAPLISEISTYIIGIKRSASSSAVDLPSHEAPTSKKRKLENGHDLRATGDGDAALEATWRLPTAKNDYRENAVSFQMPQRKKLALSFVPSKDGGVRAQGVGEDGTVEFGIGWKDVDQVFCLPVPEKAKRSHNFVVLPKAGNGVSPSPSDPTYQEPMIWTYDEPPPKALEEGQDPGPKSRADMIDRYLKPFGKRVIFPEESQFASDIVQSHRKGEKAFHATAHRGTKDGYLYFLSVGILFAFKKPLAFFPFDIVSSISYTSVLQRTFNLVVTTSTEPEQEIEFQMLDQENYAGINAYVKKHGLQDASLAEQRKAKKLNINKPEVDENGVAEEGEDGQTELQKAELQLQDEEDEEEEDYDPGSDSDGGSPTTSDDEEEEGYERGGGDEEEEEEEEEEGDEDEL